MLVALPLGFVHEAFAVAAGIFGLYFTLPMPVALGLVMAAERRPPPPVLVRVLVALVLVVWVPFNTFWALLLARSDGRPQPWPLAVVGYAAVRLWRASTSGSAAAGGRSGGSGGGG